MISKLLAFRFVWLTVAAIFLGLCSTAVAQTKAGVIKAQRVVGEVTKQAADGSAQLLKNGDVLTESDTVITTKGAGVVLVFANGSSIKLGAESKLAIEQFKMDPLQEDVKIADLQAEPSVSQTAVNLSYGEIVGDVKKLNTAGGSKFTIKTPVGAAGIRGTQFRIVFRPTGDGRAFDFKLSTNEGLVEFTGSTSGSATVPVPADVEVSVTATVDPATNQITAIEISTPAGISPEAKAAIVEAVQTAIQQAQADTTITVSEQVTVSTTTTSTTPTNEQKEPPSEQKTGDQLTPGAGK